MNPIDRQLALQLVSERAVPLLAHFALLAILVAFIWNEDPGSHLHQHAAVWAGGVAIAWIGRVALWRRIQRQPPATPTILLQARLTMLALGLTWGLGAALVIHHLSAGDALIIVLGLTGLLAGGLATLAADKSIYSLYALGMMTPVLVSIAIAEPGRVRVVTPLLILMFLAFTIRLHRRAFQELWERLQAQEHQRTLLRELQAAAAQVRTLEGILPICASCKRIRNEHERWEAVESYVRDHTNAEFTHGLCPDCAARDWG